MLSNIPLSIRFSSLIYTDNHLYELSYQLINNLPTCQVSTMEENISGKPVKLRLTERERGEIIVSEIGRGISYEVGIQQPEEKYRRVSIFCNITEDIIDFIRQKNEEFTKEHIM